jgi:hypothetical protein
LCHDEVTVLDAVSVVLLLDTSMDSNGSLVASTNPLHTTFPEDPTRDYLREAEAVLRGSLLPWRVEILKILKNSG